MKKKSQFFKRPSDYYDIMMQYYPGMTRSQVRLLVLVVDTVISLAIQYQIVMKIGTKFKEDFILVPKKLIWKILKKIDENPISVLGENIDNSKLEKLYKDVKRNKKQRI